MCYSQLSSSACTSDGKPTPKIPPTYPLPGGTYDSGLCVYAVNQASCTHTWFTCSSLDLQTCSDCANGQNCTEQAALAAHCYVNDQVECQNQNECEASGGVCSDRQYLFQGGIYGGCVIDR